MASAAFDGTAGDNTYTKMRYQTIGDIYSANEKFRQQFIDCLTGISDEEASTKPAGEKWCIQQIVEHVSLVEAGAKRICTMLIDRARADGKAADGTFSLSPSFSNGAGQLGQTKLEAPDVVQPKGDVPIEDSLLRLAKTSAELKELRADFEAFDHSAHSFPHPYFGPLNAGEWLVVIGLHEQRHADQIRRWKELLRQ
jgi:hypothetical protein